MKWFYLIQGTGSRLVKKDGEFATAEEATSAGKAYLENNRASLSRIDDPHEIFTVMTGFK
jgi:hypothetical protein